MGPAERYWAMDRDEVFQREIDFHRQVARRLMENLAPVPPRVVQRYALSRHWRMFPKEAVFHFIRRHARDRERVEVCEFGCGDGVNCCEIALAIPRAHCFGFDLSPDLIQVARARARLNRVEDRVEFVVANAERDPLQGRRFDVMLALAVIHHLDIGAVLPTLLKGVRPGGLLIFSEPVAFSPLLQRLRNLLPVDKEVSPDERQLSREEVESLCAPLERPRVFYYRLFSRLCRLLPHADNIEEHPLTGMVVRFLFRLDSWLLAAIPFLRRFAGHVLIVGRRPEKD